MSRAVQTLPVKNARKNATAFGVITLLPRIEYEYKKMNWMVQIINVSKCVM
jgi:hypothetical protein